MIKGTLSATCGSDTLANPAVVVEDIRVSDLPGRSHPATWTGLVDTGASRSVVPIEVCRDLGLAARDMRSPLGFDHGVPRKLVPRYYLRLDVSGLESLPLLVYAVERKTILLGRDFLANLVLVLDSPSGRFAIGKLGNLTGALLRLLSLR